MEIRDEDGVGRRKRNSMLMATDDEQSKSGVSEFSFGIIEQGNYTPQNSLSGANEQKLTNEQFRCGVRTDLITVPIVFH